MHAYRLLATLLAALHAAPPASPCKGDGELGFAIEALAGSRTVEAALPHLRVLGRHPYESACHLVRALHPIRPSRLVPNDAAHRDAWEVIWAIRGLRYLTGGKDFAARTSFTFGAADATRRELLERDRKNVVPFFRLWPSRDIIFVAPRDAQVAIIAQWRQWLERDASTFEFTPVEDIESWYF